MRVNDQRGSILIYSLLLLAFTITISFAMQNVALMEYKMSLYEHRANQARELAESAAWIAMEEINGILHADHTFTAELPSQIELGNDWPLVFTEDKTMQVSGAACEEQKENSCTYSFTTCGNYKGAEKNLYVQVLFRFDDIYTLQYDGGDWYYVFSRREFLDRGNFTVFQEIE